MMQAMKKLGCSLTYGGHGLEDCYDKDTGWPGTVPSKLAWSFVTSNGFV